MDVSAVEINLKAGELLTQVRGILDPGISRTTLWRWRTDLGLVDGPFSLEQLKIIAAYGKFKRLGCTKTLAKIRAAEWLEENGDRDWF